MEVQLTPDQEALVNEAVSSGRYRTPADAVLDAMTRWESAERSRRELIAALDLAEMDLDAGRYNDYAPEDSARLAEELKRESRQLRDRNGK